MPDLAKLEVYKNTLLRFRKVVLDLKTVRNELYTSSTTDKINKFSNLRVEAYSLIPQCEEIRNLANGGVVKDPSWSIYIGKDFDQYDSDEPIWFLNEVELLFSRINHLLLKENQKRSKRFWRLREIADKPKRVMANILDPDDKQTIIALRILIYVALCGLILRFVFGVPFPQMFEAALAKILR